MQIGSAAGRDSSSRRRQRAMNPFRGGGAMYARVTTLSFRIEKADEGIRSSKRASCPPPGPRRASGASLSWPTAGRPLRRPDLLGRRGRGRGQRGESLLPGTAGQVHAPVHVAAVREGYEVVLESARPGCPASTGARVYGCPVLCYKRCSFKPWISDSYSSRRFAIFFAITVHEAAHAWMANQTRRPDGGRPRPGVPESPRPYRPVRHDHLPAPPHHLSSSPVFGWAKPVPTIPATSGIPAKTTSGSPFAGPIANYR